MNWFFVLKTVHILTATVLFGTGIGIAFFMFMSRTAKSLEERDYAVRMTVTADYLFTLPAVVLQPLSGIALIFLGGHQIFDFWLIVTYGLYVFVGLCWLPVVWIQIQLKTMVAEALASGTELPQRYHDLFRLWFWLGWPAFSSLIAIFLLMVFRPL